MQILPYIYVFMLWGNSKMEKFMWVYTEAAAIYSKFV